jgi:hypothetical protein
MGRDKLTVISERRNSHYKPLHCGLSIYRNIQVKIIIDKYMSDECISIKI